MLHDIAEFWAGARAVKETDSLRRKIALMPFAPVPLFAGEEGDSSLRREVTLMPLFAGEEDDSPLRREVALMPLFAGEEDDSPLRREVASMPSLFQIGSPKLLMKNGLPCQAEAMAEIPFQTFESRSVEWQRMDEVFAVIMRWRLKKKFPCDACFQSIVEGSHADAEIPGGGAETVKNEGQHLPPPDSPSPKKPRHGGRFLRHALRVAIFAFGVLIAVISEKMINHYSCQWAVTRSWEFMQCETAENPIPPSIPQVPESPKMPDGQSHPKRYFHAGVIFDDFPRSAGLQRNAC